MFEEQIIPFKGTKSIQLYSDFTDIIEILRHHKIEYAEEKWEAEDETVPNPWKVLVIKDRMSLFFASNDKLFKIVFWDKYCGCLNNGISFDMSIEEVERDNPLIQYNDWDEIYESPEGYWIEDNLDTGKLLSITIFIKEIDEEDFDLCNW